jgi:hypothetical protein
MRTTALNGCRMSAVAAALLAFAASVAAGTLAASDARQSVAQMARQNVATVLTTFEFDQSAPTADVVTIVFANSPADPRKAPSPSAPFGEAVVQKFSFPLRTNSKISTHASYSTRVSDRAFLDARYIRVVNSGITPWNATNITLTVAGQRVLNRVAMYPRKANDKLTDPRVGLAGWNAAQWRPVYWETELFRYTHPAKIY